MKYFILILFILIYSLELNPIRKSFLVIWNVGQGQAISYIDPFYKTCLHFDMGGDRAPTPGPFDLCRFFKNYLILSHWDWDHINYVATLPILPRGICRLLPTRGSPLNPRKRFVLKIPLCSPTAKNQILNRYDIQVVYRPILGERKSSNDMSLVLTLKALFLIPGDSTKKSEKIWSQKSELLKKVKHLVLGHHGSHTSTSDHLLQSLPQLLGSSVSARKAKYGHPHGLVKTRLKKRKVPLLSTEVFGNLWIEF